MTNLWIADVKAVREQHDGELRGVPTGEAWNRRATLWGLGFRISRCINPLAISLDKKAVREQHDGELRGVPTAEAWNRRAPSICTIGLNPEAANPGKRHFRCG